MLMSPYIYFEVICLTLVSGLYDLIQYILYLIFVGTHSKLTVPLVKNYVITNGPIYGISYLYAVCLVSVMLSLIL